MEGAGGPAESPAEAAEELRIDPSDGQPYNQQSFLQVYGNLDAWNAAQPAATNGTAAAEGEADAASGAGGTGWFGQAADLFGGGDADQGGDNAGAMPIGTAFGTGYHPDR